MNNAMLTQLLYCFCVLSVLLLLGAFLRGCIPALRRLFLPASVIGGFIGLFVGPIIWKGGGIPFPKEWITTWTTLPGILIVPVVASVPLGMKFGQSGGGAAKATGDVLKCFSIAAIAGVVQIAMGFAVGKVFAMSRPDLNVHSMFGYELSQGFAGGHGTAGVIGSYYKGLDLPYWELAQGITTTTATFGIVGGMLIGIVAINIAARKGRTVVLSKPSDIPLDMAKGYQIDPAKQQSLGKETTLNSSIESLSFHLAIVLAGCGIAYILLNLVKIYKVPVISQVPIWPYALVVMFGINALIQKLGLGTLVDAKTKSRIAGTCSDYAIVAAIASMPVQTILQYIVPLLVMVVLGWVLTYAILFTLFRVFFKDCPFERAMAFWGCYTGVFLTGLVLLKIVDPEYKLPVLSDYSVAFSIISMSGFILLPLIVGIMLNRGFAVSMLFQLACLAVYLVILCISVRMTAPGKPAANRA